MEAETQRKPEGGKTLGSRLVRASQQSASPGAEADDRRSLASDHAEVVIRGHVRPALEAQVQNLPLDDRHRHPVKCFSDAEGQVSGDSGLSESKESEVGGPEESITSIDGLPDSPDAPEGGPVTPGNALILDIVVDEGELVEELDGGRHRPRNPRITSGGGAR